MADANLTTPKVEPVAVQVKVKPPVDTNVRRTHTLENGIVVVSY
jgi:hypothetical protein